MLTEDEQDLLAYLEGFLTQRRKERMRMVLEQRTRYIACVLEDLYDPRNGSAVIRHCDALGVHEIHAVENKNRFRSDEQVDMGTAQWLDLRVYRNNDGIPRTVKARRRALAEAKARAKVSAAAGHSADSPDADKTNPENLAAAAAESIKPPSRTPAVLASLKDRGYRIVATSPHTDDVTPETLDLASGPVAVVFGTEKYGISEAVRESADVFLRIPMVGFVESFNISASAAIVFHVLSGRLRGENLPWHLAPEDAERIYFNWVCRGTPHAEKLIKKFKNIREQRHG